MSDIRFNSWYHQSGTGGVIQDASGNIGIGTTSAASSLVVIGDANFGGTGIITAKKFSGPIEGGVTGGTGSFTGPVTISDTTNATSTTTGALKVTGGVGIGMSLHVGGNVSIGGTLTYEDVTNIDSVGLITARTGIKVTAGGIDVTAGGIEVTAGGIDIAGGELKVGTAVTVGTAGVVTATSYYGSGANLSDLPASAPVGTGTDKTFFLNDVTVTQSYTIPNGSNAGSFGPIAIASNKTVTVPSGSYWTIV